MYKYFLVVLTTIAILLTAFGIFADKLSKPSSCHPDFKTKTIYLDSPDNPTFWTLKTAQGEWGCKKKKKKGKI